MISSSSNQMLDYAAKTTPNPRHNWSATGHSDNWSAAGDHVRTLTDHPLVTRGTSHSAAAATDTIWCAYGAKIVLFI